MTPSIDEAVAALVQILTGTTITVDGVAIPLDHISAYAIDPIGPPFIEVMPSVTSDYLSFDDEGLSFGGNAILHLAILATVPDADNDIVVGQINDLIGQVVRVLDPTSFYVASVSRPGGVDVAGQPHFGVAIEVATEVHL
jgi:hypothetical protein